MDFRVLITGASGLLGRAVYRHFTTETSWKILGLAFSRATGGLRKVDITKQEELSDTFDDFKPNVVIHAAAERRPDIVEREEESVKLLNIEATRNICEEAKKIGAYVVFISTDYVFDGSSPPYQVTDEPNPLNKYGQSKRAGEITTLSVDENNIVLRVPIMYGDITSWEESAITVLFPKVWNKHEKCVMSDYERRYPTHCDDVSSVLRQLVEKKQQDSSLSGIFHWSGDENLTKYDMCLTMAKAFALPTDHIMADKNKSGGTNRPYDAHLDPKRLETLGISKLTPFAQGIQSCIIRGTFTNALVLPKID